MNRCWWSICTAVCLFCLVSTSMAKQTTEPETEKDLGYNPQPTEARKETWKNMVGNWYGERTLDDGGTYYWIIRRNVVGQYQLEGKVIDPYGREKVQIEVGEWGVGGGIYFTIFKGWVKDGQFVPNDQSDPYYRDVYKIIELNEESFKYKHLDSGRTYTVEKVADDHKLPSSP